MWKKERASIVQNVSKTPHPSMSSAFLKWSFSPGEFSVAHHPMKCCSLRHLTFRSLFIIPFEVWKMTRMWAGLVKHILCVAKEAPPKWRLRGEVNPVEGVANGLGAGGPCSRGNRTSKRGRKQDIWLSEVVLCEPAYRKVGLKQTMQSCMLHKCVWILSRKNLLSNGKFFVFGFG